MNIRRSHKIIFWSTWTLLMLAVWCLTLMSTQSKGYYKPQRDPVPLSTFPVIEQIALDPVEPKYSFSEDDIYLMAVLLSGSKDVDGDGEFDIDFGRDEERDQISLVLCTVMNRVKSELFPNTIREVIFDEGQFAVMPQWKESLPEVSDISVKRVKEWCGAYAAGDLLAQSVPTNHYYFYGDGQYNYSR